MNLKTLIWVTMTTGVIDSLNPIAIAQQFALQSVVEKKRSIVAFIVGIAMTNYVAGLLVYYGLAALFRNWMDALLSKYEQVFQALGLVAGFVCIVGGLFLVYRKWIVKDQIEEDFDDAVKKPLSLSPFSLFLMGIVFCCLELTSAVPYFAYLAFVVQADLSLPTLLVFLFVYQIIYSLPLIALLVLSAILSEAVEKVYRWFQMFVCATMRIAPPLALVAVGAFFIYTSV